MYTIFDKLYLARLLLSLNARDIAIQAGITPVTISLLERGERKNIPAEYIKFLYEKGIDINWLFDDNENITLGYRKDFRNSVENDLKDVNDQLKRLNLKLDNYISTNHPAD